MKNKLLIAFALALMVPWAVRAQSGCTQTVPYVQDFESFTGTTYNASTDLEMPSCWNGYSSSTSSTNTYIPRVVSGTGTYVYYHGAKGFAMTGGTNTTYGMNKYVLLPPMSVPLNQLQLTFWMCTESNSASFGVLHVGYVTSDDTSTFVSVANYPSSAATQHSGNGLQASGVGLDVELVLSQIPASATRLAFKWEHGNSSYHTVCIDDIVVSYPPTCPRVESLVAAPASDEAVLSWTEMGSANQWEIAITSGNTTTVEMATSNPYTVMNLNANSDYTAVVRAVCGAGDTSLARSVAFHTACAPVPIESLPYTYGFEDATGTSGTSTFNSCFGRYRQGTTTAYPYPSSTSHTGTKSLYFYRTSAIYSWVTLPLFEEDLTELQLSFWAYRSTTATYGYWAVGVMSDPSDISTFDTIASGQVSSNSTWELVEVPLSNYTGTGGYLAILSPLGSAVSYLYVDDIKVDYIPSCPRPVDVVATPTPHSATLQWTGTGESYIVEYGRQGFELGTGDSLEVTDNFVQFTGLQMGTDYVAYISSICSGDTTLPTYATFATTCSTITAADLPYFENFESYASGTSNPINGCWNKGTNSSTAYPYPFSTNAINGQRNLYFYANRAASATGTHYYSWAAMPRVDDAIDMSNLMLEFEARRYSTTTAAYHSTIVVGIADTNVFASAAQLDSAVVWIDTLDLTPEASLAIQHREVSFEDYVGNGRYVVFYAPSPAQTTAVQYNYVYIDDVNLMFIPTCFKPTELRVEDYTYDGATLSWTPDERTPNPPSWYITYGTEGFSVDAGSAEFATDTTVTLTGLSADTRYEVRVAADCGGGQMSDPRSIVFRTACTPIEDLPYVEDFEAYESGSTNPISTCWRKGAVGTSTQYPYPYSSNAITGDRSLYFYGVQQTATSTAASIYSYAALPAFSTSMDQLMLSFKARRYTSTTATYHSIIAVGVMSNADDPSTFDTVQVFDLTAEEAGTVHELVVDFSNYTGNGTHIAIMGALPAVASSAQYNVFYVDDVTVGQVPGCSRAQGIALVTTHEEATFTVSDTANVNNYIFTLTNLDDTAAEAITQTATATTVTISNLLPSTNYRVSMISDCGDGSYTLPLTKEFRTACSPIADSTLPYIEDFENYSSGSSNEISPCWTKAVYGTSTQYPYPYTTAASAGSIGLFGFSSGTVQSYAALPLFATPLSDLMVSFNVKRSNTATYNCEFYVGVMTNPTDLSTFDTLGYVNLTDEPTGSVQRLNYSLLGYQGTGHLAIFFAYSSATNYVYIDSVVVDHLPDCVWPQNLAVDSTSPTTVGLSWMGNGTSYELQRSVSPDFDSLLVSTTVTGSSTVVTGLDNYTRYYFRLRTVCGNETSMWSNTVATQTLVDCGPNNINIIDTIGNGTSNSYFYTFGAYSTYYTGYSTSIYTTQELNNMGLMTNNRINGIQIHSGNYAGTIRKAKVYLTETALDEFATTTPANDTVDRNSMTLVYSGDLEVVPNSWIEIPFSTPFAYSGNQNLMVTLAHDTNSVGSLYFYYTSTSPVYRSVYGSRSSTTTTNNTATRTYSRTNMVFNICTGVPTCMRPTNVTVDGYTDTLATLHWDSVAEAYQVYYSTSEAYPDTLASISPLSCTANSITLTGLQSNATYYVYVRSVCEGIGNSDWSLVQSFTTACSPMPLPYTEDFEGYGTGSTQLISPCWRKYSSTSTAYPYPYATNAINGQRSLYFYGYRSSSATAVPTYSYAVLPMFQDSVRNLALSMNVRRYSSTAATYTTFLKIGVMTNPDDLSTFDVVDTIDLHDETPLSVHGYEHYFSDYTGNGRYIAILDGDLPIYPGNTTCYSYAYVDDIVVDYIPSCPRVSSVHLTNITSTSAIVHWDASPFNGATFELEYGVKGFTQGMGTVLTTTGDSIVLTGLEPGSDYSVYVRALCSATDEGNWSFVQHFSTVCAPRSLPMFFDPDNYTTGSSAAVPTCWNRTNDATGTSNYYPYILSSSTNSHTGNNILYYYLYNYTGYAQNEVMAFPEIDTTLVPMNQVEMSIWAKSSVAGKRIVAGVMTNPNSLASFVGVDTVRLSTTVSEYTLSLANYTGNGSYAALKVFHDSTGSFYVYVDDITISQISPCPRAYDLTASNGTQSTVDLGWTDTIGSTSWKLAYRAIGETAWTEVTTSANPYTLTGLTANSNYEFRVAPICSDGQQADWSRETKAFSTSQVPAAMPYSYDFESAVEWANWQTSSNSVSRWYRGVVNNGNATNTLYISTDNGQTNSWQSGSIVNAVAYRDIDFGTDTGSYAVSFRFRGGGCNEGAYDGVSVMLVDPAVTVTNSSTALESPWGRISYYHARLDTTWDEHTVLFDGVAGVRRLAFIWFQSTTSTHTYTNVPPAIDDISIEVQVCERPYGLVSDQATTNSVSLMWEGDIAGTYVVDYRPVGTTGTDGFDTVTGTLIHTVYGLAPSTAYNFWVRRLCDDTTVSYWSSYITVNTLCAPLSVHDTIRESFENVEAVVYSENGQLPTCWSSWNTSTSSPHYPHVTGSGSYSYWIDGTHALTMTAGLASNSYGNNSYVRLPEFVDPLNTVTMSFWMSTESSSNGTLYIGYLTGDDYENDFVSVKQIAASTATVHSGDGLQDANHGIRDTVSFAAVPAGNYPICLKWVYTSSYYSVCIDDVAIWSSFICENAGIIDTSTTETTATVSFESITYTNEVAIVEGEWNENALRPVTVFDSTYTFTGLAANTAYTIGVRSACSQTWSTVTVTTQHHPCFVPDAPTVGNVTFNSASFAWTAAEQETEWDIHIFGTGYDSIATTATTAYSVNNLRPNVVYSVAVRSHCSDDLRSPWSDTVSFTTVECVAVSDVVVGTTTTTSAQVSWTAPAGVSRFEIEYGAAGFGSGTGTRLETTTNSATLTGLTSGISYDVYVRSVCADGIVSNWSSVANFETRTEGIDDVNSANIVLFPNPATTTVTLTGIDGQATVTIVDMNGRVSGEWKVENGKLTIDLTGYAQGAYFVRITGEQLSAIRKLIVK